MNDGGPAFPYTLPPHPGAFVPRGMSLRDYFAAAALTAALTEHGTYCPSDAVFICYKIADAMLAAREQSEICNQQSAISRPC